MKAIVIGATGATGRDLVNELLKDPGYTETIVLVRRTMGLSNPKLVEILTDFEKPEDVANKIRGNVLFSVLGTTLKIAGSKEKQWHIDYEIPLRIADIAKRNGATTMVLLSAYGAKSSSNVFYSKMKGQLEEAILKIGFNNTIIFKPGLLLRKNTDRFGERVAGVTLSFFNKVGLFKRFRPMPTSILAGQLAKAGKVDKVGTKVIELDDIFKF